VVVGDLGQNVVAVVEGRTESDEGEQLKKGKKKELQ
jgi:hypothetical protein